MIHATAIGRLVDEPELRFLNDGTAVANMRIACNRARGRDGSAAFIGVSIRGRMGEACAEYLEKGQQVTVLRETTQSNWVTDDGEKRSKLELRADHLDFGAKAKPKADEESAPKKRTTTSRKAKAEAAVKTGEEPF